MKRAHASALLATKLRPPGAVKSEITRQAARSLLDGGLDQSLCVVATAGSGKSTFLRQLHFELEQQGSTCAWLNLDARDNDPATLIPYLFDAFAKLGAADTGAIQFPVDYDDPSQIASVFAMLEHYAIGMQGKKTLFLDDFHYVQNTQLLEQMNHLLDACVGQVQIVIGARVLPELRISRRVLSGQFAALPENILKFSQQEAEQFFSVQNAAELDPEEVSALNRSTEGWVAGLQFAAISLRNRPAEKDDLISNLSGGEAQVAEFLATNVFEDLPDEMQNFLLKTAPLGRFNEALCRHVTRLENVAAILQRLLDANLFLIPLDRDGEWFRYHHLFADFLNATSRRKHPQDQEDIRLLASTWCINNDLPDEAITYFLEIEHYEQAADLIAKVAIHETRDNGDHRKVLRWINGLPKRYRRHHPEMVLSTCLALGFSRGATEAKELLDEFHIMLASDNSTWVLSEDQTAEHKSYAEMLEILLFEAVEKSESTLADAQRWFQKWPDAPIANGAFLRNVIAYSHLSNNRFAKAKDLATEARLYGLQAESPYVAIWADCLTAMAHTASGDPQSARAFVGRASREADASMADHTLLKLMVPLLSAHAAYEQGQTVKAFSVLSHGAGFASTFGPLEPLLIALRLQSQMFRHKGNSAGALAVLEKGQHIGDAHDLPRLSITMLAEQITLLLETGETGRAKQICDQWGLLDRSWSQRFGTGNPMQLNNLKRIEIEMALALGSHKQALLLCQSLAAELRVSGRPRTRVRVGILKSVALNASGEVRKAWQEMSATIRMARPSELVSSFSELQHLCLPIIRDIIKHRILLDGGAEPLVEAPEDWLIGRLAGGDVNGTPRQEVSQPEKAIKAEVLTPRELEMLQMAAQGCTNAQIGTQLLVSVATVKWHMHNAFQKLGVRNRITALSRARELGLLSEN